MTDAATIKMSAFGQKRTSGYTSSRGPEINLCMNSKLWALLSLLVLLSLISPSLIAGTEDIVFRDKWGRVLTKRDLQYASGTFEWSIPSSVKVSDQARREHEAGRVAGQKGDYKAAIASFNAAAKAAPNWPYPNYDLAYTYLLQGDFAGALKHYQLVDQAAPRGFFTVKTAVDTLRREQSGELPKGTYLSYVALEWEGNKQKVRSAVSAMTKSIPNFAPAWKTAANFEDEPTKRLAMLEAGLKARPDAETKGFLLINKALTLRDMNRANEGREILGTLSLDPNSPGDIEAIARATFADLERSRDKR